MKKNKVKNIDLQYGPYYYASHLRAFLGEDQYVTVVVDEKNMNIDVVVSGCEDKAEALERILITDEELQDIAKDTYGIAGYKLTVNGKRASWKQTVSRNDVAVALAGNKFFKGIEEHKIPIPGTKKYMTMTFGILKPIPCQAPCDDISDPYGMQHFLAKDFLKFALTKRARKVVAWATDRL